MPIAGKNSECMYTEEEMKKRINKLRPVLMAMGGFDVLVTHAPLRHYGDREDLPHKGFECFEELLNKKTVEAMHEYLKSLPKEN